MNGLNSDHCKVGFYEEKCGNLYGYEIVYEFMDVILGKKLHIQMSM